MNSRNRIITIILALILCLSVFAGCGDNGDGGDATSSGVKRYTYTDGIHIYTAPETEDYIVKDGKTDYQIVIPENADAYALWAAEDLVQYFNQATGLLLNVITESGEGLVHNENNKYISIGKTKLSQQVDMDIDFELMEYDGFRIRTFGKSIFIDGYDPHAALYGTYQFLRLAFNWEAYAYNTWTMDENVVDLKLCNYDVLDIPDAKMRVNWWGGAGANNRIGFKLGGDANMYMLAAGDVEGGAPQRLEYHNSTKVIYNGEREWYSDNGDQLCYTAHGDEESFVRMLDKAAEVIQNSLIAQKGRSARFNTITISMQDNGNVCTCDACAANFAKYGQHVGSVIVFMNKVMERVSVWMDKPENAEYARQDLHLLFFAYNAFVTAPGHYDESLGKFVPNHPDLVTRDDVGVFLATDTINTFKDIYHRENDAERNNIEAWASLTDFIYYWTYQHNFYSFVSMHDTFDFYDTDGYQFFMANKAYAYKNQGMANGADQGNLKLTGYNGLKMYLNLKLIWDCTLDSDVLTDNWFNAMFGAAAPTMRELYESERYYSHAMYDRGGYRDAYRLMISLKFAKHHSHDMLTHWLDLIDQAHHIAADAYKDSDPELYNVIKTNINHELVGVASYYASTQSVETAGQRYIDVFTYINDNLEEFSGFQGAENSGNRGDLKYYWPTVLA